MKIAVLLLSGGFDSAVAGYKMKKRGMNLIALHCSLEPILDDSSTNKAKAIAKYLGIKIHVVKIGKQLAEITKLTNPRYYFVLQKRFLLRISEKLARMVNAEYIVTGDNLGQVSSQTLHNLVAITKGANLPVLRPLLTYDKQEIINLAKEINTYELCLGPEMCDALGPKNPITRAKVEKVLNEEARVDVKSLANQVAKELGTIARNSA